MGLSYVTMEWFERLHRRGVFADKQSILELGPQDFVGIKADDISRFHKNIRGSDLAPADAQRNFFGADGRPRWWTATRDLYAILGLTEYHGADTEDPRASIALDLNYPTTLPRKFDVITDYGTIEHIFNIANAIKFIYDHLEIGGVALHVLPTRGDYNHGFYNLHATFFTDLCAANGFELIDLLFVPDFGRQNEYRNREDASGKPLLMDTRQLEGDFLEKEFAAAVLAHRPGERGVADFLFAAIRKVDERHFVYPIQDNYAALNPLRGLVNDPAYHKRRQFGIHIGLACEYYSLERWTQAADEMRMAMPLLPDDPESLYDAALKCWNAGHYLPEAILFVQHICKLTPQDDKAFRFLDVLQSGKTPADIRRLVAG